MRKVILDSPRQLKEGLKFAKGIKLEGNFNNVVVCAMGGSALPANILLDWMKEKIKKENISPIPVYIHRDYGLPPQANKKSFIVCISYSGNTEETISALREAIKNKFKVSAIGTGGKMKKISQKNKIPFVKIPSGIQPRCATGYLFSSLAKILENSKIIKKATKEITDLSEKLEKIDLEKEGKKITKKIKGRIPLIYSSNELKTVARIWKIKFNENSKIPAFYNYFPELNHNEMVGFTNKSKDFHVIILRDKKSAKINKRMELFSSLVKKKGVKTEFVDIKKGSLLFKIFSTLYLGDWVSYYLALENNQDPTPVKIVEEFKKKL